MSGLAAGLPAARRTRVAAGLRVGRLDWVLLAAVAALCVVGTLAVYSATKGRVSLVGSDPTAYLKKNVLNLGIGAVLGCCTAFVDHRLLRAYAPVIYGAAVLGLLAVLSPLGSTIKGAHSWIVLPAGFSIQPAEFAKIGVIVSMAVLLAEKRDDEENPGHLAVLQALLVAAVPLGLIMLQPDLGTALVIGFVVVGIIAVSGAPARWVVALVLAVALGGFGAVKLGVLKPYQVARLTSFTNPQGDPTAAYNGEQAQIAIGSGGLTGYGLGHGPQTSGQFVPEQQTDFIFTVVGEEMGFVGAGGTLLLFGIVLWRGCRIAMRADDLFGRLVASGVVCWFTFQAFENVGMAMGIMPITGVPLPFLSYGGSSAFANLMAVGLLQNVHLRRESAELG